MRAKKLDIGLMLPYSSMYPMGKLFRNGITATLDRHKDEVAYELFPEFIGPASINDVNKADDKHASFNDVKIVTGIVNSKTVHEASVSFKEGTSYHFANLGEHLFETDTLNQNVAVRSLDIWKDVYSLADFAMKSFSENGAYAASFYDTGYAFAQMVDVGLKENGKKDFLPVLVSKMPPPGQQSNVEEVVERIERLMPDWVFAAFSGSEALRFLKMWKRKGLHKKIKLLGLSFFAQQLVDFDSDDVVVHSVFTSDLDEVEVRKYNEGHFFRLGTQVANQLLKGEGIDLMEDPSMEPRCIYSCSKIDKASLSLDRKRPSKKIKLSNPHVKELLRQTTSAWQNPYMCI